MTMPKRCDYGNYAYDQTLSVLDTWKFAHIVWLPLGFKGEM